MVAPGAVCDQTMAAIAAIASSASIPAAPTITRRHLLRNVWALDASMYGNGVKTRNITPSMWTSPSPPSARPNFLQAKQWLNSWHILTPTMLRYSKGRFVGLSIDDALSNNSPVLPTMW